MYATGFRISSLVMSSRKKHVQLASGGSHKFDAVAEDGYIVAAILITMLFVNALPELGGGSPPN